MYVWSVENVENALSSLSLLQCRCVYSSCSPHPLQCDKSSEEGEEVVGYSGTEIPALHTVVKGEGDKAEVPS